MLWFLVVCFGTQLQATVPILRSIVIVISPEIDAPDTSSSKPPIAMQHTCYVRDNPYFRKESPYVAKTV